MDNLAGLPIYFNDISLLDPESLSELNLNDLSSKLSHLEETFEENIRALKQQSIGNKTRTHLLGSTDVVEFIVKAITDESSWKTQTEYINHWIAKLILCHRSITMLISYLIKKCEHYKLHWNEYTKNDQSEIVSKKRQFHTVLKTLSMISGLCQNIGLAIDDYSRLHGQIKSNINVMEKDFIRPRIPDPEITVSERLSRLYLETENCLLVNPSESILGFSAVRIELESFITIRIQDKMRKNIRIRYGNNDLDAKFTSKLKTDDIFEMVKDLFPNQKEYDALNMIYSMASKTVHRAIPIANYLSWGSLRFVLDFLEKKINDLDPEDKKLETTISKLESEGKLLIGPSKWYK